MHFDTVRKRNNELFPLVKLSPQKKVIKKEHNSMGGKKSITRENKRIKRKMTTFTS